MNKIHHCDIARIHSQNGRLAYGSIAIGGLDRVLTNFKKASNDDIFHHHLYILSSDKLKEGDWYINSDNLRPNPIEFLNSSDKEVNEMNGYWGEAIIHKIVASTDELPNVHLLNDDFISKYIDRSRLDHVGFEYIISETILIREVEEGKGIFDEDGNIPYFSIHDSELEYNKLMSTFNILEVDKERYFKMFHMNLF